MSNKSTEGVGDPRTNPKSPNYETYFANAFTLRISDNDCSLRFMISEDPNRIEIAEWQSAVMMTPRSLKVLAGILLDAILELEHVTGIEFPTREERYRKMFEAAKAGWASELPQPANPPST